jgi:hypothetical protein
MFDFAIIVGLVRCIDQPSPVQFPQAINAYHPKFHVSELR